MLGLCNPLMCRVVVLENPKFWQQRAYSVLVIDTKNCIYSALGGKVFLNRIKFVWF